MKSTYLTHQGNTVRHENVLACDDDRSLFSLVLDSTIWSERFDFRSHHCKFWVDIQSRPSGAGASAWSDQLAADRRNKRPWQGRYAINYR